MSWRASRGFTLIELMIIVAIVGILATVALPQFQNYQYRSRSAERAVIMRAIRASLDDYYAREGRFPGGGIPSTSTAMLNWNPDAVADYRRRAWRIAGPDDWRRLAFEVEGTVWYRYWAFAQMVEGSRFYWIEAKGDLDGDGVVNDLQKLYQYTGAVLQKPAALPPHNVCDDCTQQVQLGSDFTF